MSHVPHELHDEFPDHADRLHDLKLSDAHFSTLADKYHELNRSIHRVETRVEPTDDVTLEIMKKQRLALKDQIAALL
jgi:uncharacterized protein YdcH (DUF465 family)